MQRNKAMLLSGLLLLMLMTVAGDTEAADTYVSRASANPAEIPASAARAVRDAQANRRFLSDLLALEPAKENTRKNAVRQQDSPQVTDNSSPPVPRLSSGKTDSLPTPALIDAGFRERALNQLYVEAIEDMNFDYLTFKTASVLEPLHVFDDGMNTYLELKPRLLRKNLQIAVQTPGDQVQSINYTKLDKFIKLKGIFKAIRLSTGTRTCEIINKSYYTDI